MEQMTTKETSNRSLGSSTAFLNEEASRSFALIPWVHRWDHSNDHEQVKLSILLLLIKSVQNNMERDLTLTQILGVHSEERVFLLASVG
ncbi:hypothetical protein TNCV_3426761 [Trichonephila clavipes]|nr:hypothetical protein TNCV_3426761 [Trichonephila clavipes]